MSSESREGTEKQKAGLYEGDKLLADDLHGFTHSTKKTRGGHVNYSGSFYTEKADYLDTGGPYMLKLSDGREAEVTVWQIYEGRVDFIALGPFERKNTT